MANLRKPADIFIVDDSPQFIRIISQLLTDKGYKVSASKNSEKVIELARSMPPSLFLLDINMPVLDGYALCEALKIDQELQSIPVIFISAHDKPINKVKAFDVGGVDYISKPIDAAELGARINNHLQLYRLQKDLQFQVEKQTRELSETLTALRILMNQDKREAQDIEKTLLSNIDTSVMPFLRRLKKTTLNNKQSDIVEIVLANLAQLSVPPDKES